MDHATAEWVADVNDRMHAKLAKVGLVAARAKTEAVEAAKLGPFAVVGYMESRSTLKPGTLTAYGHTRRNLLAFFGADKLLADFTNGNADEFDSYLNRPKAKKGWACRSTPLTVVMALPSNFSRPPSARS